MADDSNGFRLGSAYIIVTADMTGFAQSVKDGAAKANVTAAVKITPDTSAFKADLDAALAKDAADSATDAVRAGT